MDRHGGGGCLPPCDAGRDKNPLLWATLCKMHLHRHHHHFCLVGLLDGRDSKSHYGKICLPLSLEKPPDALLISPQISGSLNRLRALPMTTFNCEVLSRRTGPGTMPSHLLSLPPSCKTQGLLSVGLFWH